MKRGGSALIVSLWMVTLFSLFGASLGFRGGLETQMMNYPVRMIEMQSMALGGVRYIAFLIESDPNPGVTTRHSPWYGKIELPSELPFRDRLTLQVLDEESKINLNKASPEVLEALFKILRRKGVSLETEDEDLISGIILWRGGSWGRGKTALDFEPKRAPFESLEELFLIPFISRSDVENLRDYVTVYGNTNEQFLKVNVNTASPVILEALVQSLSGDEFAKQELLQKWVAFRDYLEKEGASLGRLPHFTSGDLDPENFIRLLNLSTTIPMVSLVLQLLRYLNTDSFFYEVKVEVRGEGRMPHLYARAILGSRYMMTRGAGGGLFGFYGTQAVTAPLSLEKGLDILLWSEETLAE